MSLNTTLVLNIIQIALAAVIIVLVMLQAKSSGLSTVFGGGGFQSTRRGGEKFLHRLTIVSVILFLAFSLARVVFYS